MPSSPQHDDPAAQGAAAGSSDPARLRDADLLRIVVEEDDALPRVLAEEVVRRGERLLAPLVDLVEDAEAWAGDDPWAAVHATLLLAAMGQPAAVPPLLTALRHADECDVMEVWDLAGRLFRPAGAEASLALLRAQALDATAPEMFRIMCLHGIAGLALDDADARRQLLVDCVALLEVPDSPSGEAAGELLAWFCRADHEAEVLAALGVASQREARGRLPALGRFSARGARAQLADLRAEPLAFYDEEERRLRGEELRAELEEDEQLDEQGHVELPPALDLPRVLLAARGDEELLALLERGDVLSPELAEEVVGRGARIAPGLEALARDEALWKAPGREAWRAKHATLLLAALGDDAPAAALLEALGHAAEHGHGEVLDWSASLFRRAGGAPFLERLLAVARDDEALNDLRLACLAASTARALEDGEARAALLVACRELLDHPDAELLLAAREWLAHLCAWGFGDEVARALVAPSAEAAEAEHPWLEDAEESGQIRDLLLQEPLAFYDEEAREERWAALAELGCPHCDAGDPDHEAHADDFDDDEDGLDGHGGPYAGAAGEELAEAVAPFVREAAKVGRNDPCPCGSGRKHKKCCLA